MSNGKILIVDDSENIRNVLESNFNYLGYDVVTANDGDDAMDLVCSERPDIIVLDVMMPGQNGFQVCRKLKAHPVLSGIPIVFLSAKGQKEDRFWGKDCGADDYLTKPFSTAELERVIERLMSRGPKALTEEQFKDELQERRLSGEGFAVLQAEFDAKALNVFRQKYGELRYHEAIDGIRQTVEVIVQQEAGESLVWSIGERSFQAILPGQPERAQALRDRIVAQSNLLLKSFYDALDAGRGYVVTRSPDDSREIHIPLLTMEATLTIEDEREES